MQNGDFYIKSFVIRFFITQTFFLNTCKMFILYSAPPLKQTLAKKNSMLVPIKPRWTLAYASS